MKTRGRNTSEAQQPQEESTQGQGATGSSSAVNRISSITTGTAVTASMNHDEAAHSDISLNLDAMGRERSSTLGSFRDRGLTLGSEFDELGLTLGLDTTHAAASAHSTMAAHPEAIEFDSAGAAASSSSQRNRTTSTSSAMDYLGMLGQAASALAYHSETSANQQSQPPQQNQKHPHPPQSNEMKQSSSKRLRSMSDLEDRGIIDKQQKGLLKDLINSGKGANNELQKALDAYEKGDTTALERMIKSGALNAKNRDDIDLLVDMDLDFLSMGNTNDYGYVIFRFCLLYITIKFFFILIIYHPHYIGKRACIMYQVSSRHYVHCPTQEVDLLHPMCVEDLLLHHLTMVMTVW